MLLLDTGDKTEGFRQFLLYSGVHLRRVSSVLRRQSWPRLHSILRVNIQELGVKIMKFVVIIVASVCANLYFCTAGNTSGNQKACPDSKQPITVNVFAKGSQKGEKGAKGDTGTIGENGSPCQCSLQNPNKPSAHIEAAKKYYVSYKAGQILKDWSVSAPYSHLAGGMKYQDGKLTVPTSGRYYIYVQAYYRGKGRISVHVNNKRVTLVHFPWPGKGDTGTALTAGVFNLKAGDVITFALEYNCIIYMDSHHTYFGAYLI